MSQAIATQPSATGLRGFAVRVWDDPDSRSTAVGLGGVLAIYLLMFLFGPLLLRVMPIDSAPRPFQRPRQFNIEISPEMLTKPTPKPTVAQKFVETNPDAPENTPDKTNNFGAQNQQVAQEKPTPDGHSERPAMEGKKDFESTQIVSGQLRKQQEHLEPPPVPETVQTPPSPATPRAEQNPLPGFEKTEGDNPNAFGTTSSTAHNNVKPIPNRVEGEKEAPLIEGMAGAQPTIDPRHPRPRPTIVKQQQVRPAILAENKFGTSNIGLTAINAKFSNYGAYLQRLIEAIQLSWDGILSEAKAYPPGGTYVQVKFVLNAEGKVARISEVENHSNDFGSRACVSAITSRAPYGEWTEDMKAVLGEEQELTFTFYYQ